VKAGRLLSTLVWVSLALAIAMAVQWQRAERRRTQAIEWTRFVLDSLGTSVRLPAPPEGTVRDSIYWQWVATTAQIQSRQWQSAVRHWATNHSILLERHEVEQLRKEGLADPVRQLRESLEGHPELIPERPVLGGTMRFAPGEQVVLLNRPYAFARYDDGHVGGVMLLEYAVQPPGTVTWKRLWSTQE